VSIDEVYTQGETSEPTLNFRLDFATIKQLPETLAELQALRRILDVRLAQDFQLNLSTPDQQRFENEGLNSLRIRRLWDEYLYDAVPEYGSLIFLSDKVLRRVHAWWLGAGEPTSDLQKLKKFLTAVQHSAEVRRGSRKAKITRKHVRYKLRVIPELKILKKRLFGAFPNDASGVIDFIRTSLSTQEFPNLYVNTASLLHFLENSPVDALGFRGSAFEGKGEVPDLSPARFLDRWLAWSAGRRSPEAVRQKMSKPDNIARPNQRK
jgi:hypothetical protein